MWPSEPHTAFAVLRQIPQLPVCPPDQCRASRSALPVSCLTERPTLPSSTLPTAAVHTEAQLLTRGIRKSADVVRRLELPPSDGSMEQTLTLCREVCA